ncbi:SusE domain-containing protein [Algivirga pacifica]|uniref:SusE outer membrane protein domain-containing protein n=1 Tax=Algivirga pacifica TaxID=1162670 RepID=A0ABP9D9V7_9BACT
MKNRYNIALAVALGLFGMTATSCTEEALKPTVLAEEERTAPVLSLDGSYVFAEETINDAMDLTWSPVNIGVNVGVSYKVELGKVGTDFAEIVELGITEETTLTVTRKDFNKGLLTLGLQADKVNNVEVRVTASFANYSGFESMTSEISTVEVTPWGDPTAFPDRLYLAGSFQGWDNSNEVTVLEPIDGAAGEYQGFFLFHEADTYFKILTKKGAWDSQWGERGDADGILDPNDGGDPDALAYSGAGFYKIYVNFATKAYEVTPVTWGVIGDATPGVWNDDTDMTFDPATSTYSVTMDLNDGQIKFRLADGWDVNLGDDNGVLTPNGPNILVSAGNYTITLKVEHDGAGAYTYAYTLVKN